MAGDPLLVTVWIGAPPERVFPYFTDPRAMVRWMGDYARLDPRPGGEFAVDINGMPVRGTYLALDPPHRLVFTWGYAGNDDLPPGASTVEVSLVVDGTGTRVDLVHRDLPQVEAPKHSAGWDHFLTRAAIAAAGGDPGPDPWATPHP